MPLVIEERVTVAVPPERLWGLLIEPRSWPTWWPAVRSARSLDFKPLKDGSRFEVDLEMGALRSRLLPRVTLCADGKSLDWSGRWLGVPCRQQWFVARTAQGSRVTSRTTFAGVGALLLRLFRLHRRWRAMVERQLRGFKGTAERLS